MTNEEKAEEYIIKKYNLAEMFREPNSRDIKIAVHSEYQQEYECYLAGLTEDRKNCMTVQNAMETIKRYCKEITVENNNCSKCIFCSKGFNGCKLQTAPCNWE